MIVSGSTLLLFAIIVLILLMHYLLKWRNRNLIYSLLPGPEKQHPLLGDLPALCKRIKSDGIHSIIPKSYRKEGICRLWFANEPNIILFSAETVQPVLTCQNLMKKSRVYNMFHCWLGTGLLTSTGKKWKERRKLITPTFHYHILNDFVSIFDSHSKIFVKNMNEFVNKDPVNIVPHVSLLTLDIICETAMGIRIGCQEVATEYVKAILEFSRICIKRIVKPWLQNDLIWSYASDSVKMKEILKILHDFSTKIVKQRKQELVTKIENKETKGIKETKKDNLNIKKRQAFLDLLLQIHLTENSITDEGICEEVNTFIFEGHDTTAAAISWTLYHLGWHRDIQQKVYEELQRIFGEDEDREIIPHDLKEMKYLECVIKESLRLSPSVPVFSRVASKEINIKGYTIPPNTTLILLIHLLHRDPTVFPNPEVFDPDRFLPENCIGRHPFAYVPFSAGFRNCIGQKFAMMEMKVTISNILRKYNFESVDPPDSIKTLPLLILRSQKGLRLKITERNN